LTSWIRHIKDVYRLHNTYLDSIQDETERFNTFVELNVKEQVLICKNINRSGSMETIKI
jgi:carbonic anhydrase